MPLHNGVWIEVRQVKSENRATLRRRETLRTLGLHGIGGSDIRRYYAGSTAGLLHRVRDLVGFRALSPEELSSHLQEEEDNLQEADVTVLDYTASGGASALLQLPSGEQLRIEAHTGDYSLVWPTELAAAGFVKALRPLLPGDQPIEVQIDADGAPIEPTLEDLTRLLAAEAPIRFVRLEYPDRIFTWSQAGATGARASEASAEAGFLGEALDLQYLASLLATAPKPLRDETPDLLRRAEQLLTRYPTARLFPQH